MFECCLSEEVAIVTCAGLCLDVEAFRGGGGEREKLKGGGGVLEKERTQEDTNHQTVPLLYTTPFIYSLFPNHFAQINSLLQRHLTKGFENKGNLFLQVVKRSEAGYIHLEKGQKKNYNITENVQCWILSAG